MRRRERRKLEHLERQRALERERTRIARDIHDELGAGLTRITLLSQSARSELPDHQPGAADVEQIFTNARELTRAMDEIVWAINPKHDTFDSLITYLGRYAQSYLSAANVRCRLDLPLHLPAWTLTAEIRHNLFLAFKEALNNVVQHARATEVRLSLELQAQGFVLILTDNGAGFDFQHASAPGSPVTERPRLAGGNGLLNMQKRLEELGGRCQWETAPGEGTRVKMTVSLHTSSKQMTTLS
jgi:signal transduction histidine kinase